jgi:hypothetical protein
MLHAHDPAEWQPMYNPSKEQAEADRRAAYEAGVPHGVRLQLPAHCSLYPSHTTVFWTDCMHSTSKPHAHFS